MNQKYIDRIAEKLSLSRKQVTSVFELSSGGATIPFMARYRKEATGNLDEVAITGIVESIDYYNGLEKRKETVLSTIESQGKLTDDLKEKIENCFEATVLEDIYLPFKPKRKTRATQAIEKGLEPLAKMLFEQGNMEPEKEAALFIGAEVASVADALQGARDIIAEWVSENEEARAQIRKLFSESAILQSRVMNSKKDEEDAQKYRDYFDFSEPLNKLPSHRLLAIRRGEKEGFLTMEISVSKEEAVMILEKILIKNNSAAAVEVKKAVEDSFTRLLRFSIETEFRLSSKLQADEEAIRVFSENLRQLLLAAPLGPRNIIAIDPGFRTGCKLICINGQGSLLHHSTIYPHPPQNQATDAEIQIRKLIEMFSIDAIGIGNGTAGRETENWLRGLSPSLNVMMFSVNESGASIYSASEVAREEFPDLDLTVRGAISIGRRLLDPLSELVKIDPKSIGVGQYQHDVNQVRLKQALDRVVESAVNYVGVNLNTASKHLLRYVSGVSASIAENIIRYRTEHGAFTSREELKKVSLVGPRTFEQCAGFLRIPGAENPLDNSSVHPERYELVNRMATDLGVSVRALMTDATARKKIKTGSYISESAGRFTVEDILKELEKPGRDPREKAEEFRFDDKVKSMDDLKPGMTLPGIITNITNFGAFVDIGVKQDGLVHVSQLSDRYISDPNEVVKLNQKVMATVMEIDVQRRRIALSLRKQNPGRDAKKKVQERKPEDFAGSLAALKDKFRR